MSLVTQNWVLAQWCLPYWSCPQAVDHQAAFLRYVYGAYLQKVYHQISVHPEYEFKEYSFNLNMFSFGVNCARYLALRSFLQAALANANILKFHIFWKNIDDVLALTIILAKLLLQQIWLERLSWNEHVEVVMRDS